jgi:hypothetical protein
MAEGCHAARDSLVGDKHERSLWNDLAPVADGARRPDPAIRRHEASRNGLLTISKPCPWSV